tara:strand:+ start:2638 stop:2844 length:207 start_codon:yes stop_codon:yes gene_type:complete
MLKAIFSGVIAAAVVGLLGLSAWLTHLWWSLSGLFSGEMDTLSEIAVALLGIFIPPLGCLHGIYLWFT